MIIGKKLSRYLIFWGKYSGPLQYFNCFSYINGNIIFILSKYVALLFKIREYMLLEHWLS